MENNVINVIAIHATAETAHPAAAVKGANIATWTGYKVLGSTQCGNDIDLDATSVEISVERTLAMIEPTRSIQAEDIVLMKNKVASVAFSVYELGEDIFTLLSDWTVTSNVGQPSSTLAFRTLAIEVNGLLIDYYPKVALFLDGETKGYGEDGAGMVNLIAFPLATATIKGGYSRTWYQSA